MQYRLNKPITTRFSSSGLRIQYQAPPTSPKDSISVPWASHPCRQRPKMPACESRAPTVKKVNKPPANAKNPLVAKIFFRDQLVVFIVFLGRGHAIYFDYPAAGPIAHARKAGFLIGFGDGHKLEKTDRKRSKFQEPRVIFQIG